jgi:hypothetical protein
VSLDTESVLPTQEYELKLDLHDKVQPAESKFTVLKTKLEICLRKAEPTHWPALMATAVPTVKTTYAPLPSAPQQPSYPTSFKR